MSATEGPDESKQKRIDRSRPPRVQLAYEVEQHGQSTRKELPFVLGVLADLSGNVPPDRLQYSERKFVEVDWDSFDGFLAGLEPRLSIELDDLIGAGGKVRVELRFGEFADFEPGPVAAQVPALEALLERRQEVAKRLSEEDIGESEAILEDVDRKLSAQVSLIMHSEPFKRLEASWRGLHYLVANTQTGLALRIRVLDVSWRELIGDFRKAVEFDQTVLFKKIYEQEYGTFGSEAFAALIGDFEFGPDPQAMAALQGISHVAAAAHAPFIAAAHPSFLNLESFRQLGDPRNIASVFDTPMYALWRSFRQSDDARYVALTLPRLLLRRPFGPDTNPVEQFDYRERFGTPEDQLWGSSAYALGVCLTNAFARYGWCAAIRGVEGGGLVSGLPTYTAQSDDGAAVPHCPTEVLITDRREKELSDLGFIPLLHLKGTDEACFFSMQTCCRPRTYEVDEATANARLTTQLQYVLTAARFAHFLKAIMRDRVGAWHGRGECERLLNAWLLQYVADDDGASYANPAQHPLREARVDVVDVPGRPGVYRAIMFLRPHFQLDELSVSFRVVVDLPAPAQ